MKLSDAEKIRQQWEANGKPECDPHTLEREFYLGTATGDKVCTKCGAAFLNGKQVN